VPIDAAGGADGPVSPSSGDAGEDASVDGAVGSVEASPGDGDAPATCGVNGQAGVCNCLVPGAPVTTRVVTDPPPPGQGASEGSGGTIEPGTYVLTDQVFYALGDAGCSQILTSEALTIVFASTGPNTGTLQGADVQVGPTGTVRESISGTYSTSGPELVEAETCPTVRPGGMEQYTATASQLITISDYGECLLYDTLTKM
jgi:hypothetical protein